MCVCVHASCAHSVVSDSSRPHGLWPARLLWPWNFQARMLECVASSFSRESSQPRDRTLGLFHVLRWQAGSLPGEPPGKPHRFIIKGSNSGSARWKRCIQQHTGKGPWSSQALQVCRSPQICMCSPTWKLSEPPPFRFLRRLHCKGTVD